MTWSGWHWNLDHWPCLGYLAHLESPLHGSSWLAMGIHKPVLKTTLNVPFQKCATHRVLSGVCWCSKSSIIVKYSFCRFLFGILYIHWFLLEDSLRVDRKRGLVVVFSLGQTLLLIQRTERQQKTTTKRKQTHFSFRFRFGFRFIGIYKMLNTTRQELSFATILDLEHQRTPLTIRWESRFWKQTFRVVLRTGLRF